MTTLTIPFTGLQAAERAARERAARLWRAYPRETVASAVLGATILALASAPRAIP